MVESSQERAKRNKYRRKKAMLKKVHKKAGIAFLCVMALSLIHISEPTRP